MKSVVWVTPNSLSQIGGKTQKADSWFSRICIERLLMYMCEISSCWKYFEVKNTSS